MGLIPAAGHGTRLGPQPCSKEMQEVGGRPVIDHLVERMRAAAPDEVRVVTRPEKRDVVVHAGELGARVITGHPADVAASLRLGLVGLADEDLVLVGFPDSLWEPADGFRRLLDALDARTDVVLGLFAAEELERSDVVVLDDGGRVSRIQVKPREPASDALWGIAVARVAALRGLAEGAEPGAHFGELACEGRVGAVHLSAEWIDVGTPESLERAREARG